MGVPAKLPRPVLIARPRRSAARRYYRRNHILDQSLDMSATDDGKIGRAKGLIMC
jgi:hypothetical protein